MSGRAAVFLDRDGVLNEIVERNGRVESPRSMDEFRLVRDAGDSVARLRQAGLATLVVTNQPDVARGLLPASVLNDMVTELRHGVGVDDVIVCPHDDADNCSCRKPQPGMLHELAARWDVDLQRSYMIGDTWRDMLAGRSAGCTTVLLRTAYNDDASGDVEVPSLGHATTWILDEIS
jgi:D-glycero-D-manno-heptose 1,7-bisphosphate phosphatase